MLADEMDRLGKKAALVITGRSLATQTPLIKQVEQSLGDRFRATFSGIQQHAPESNIKQATQLAIESQADLLISIGGGSPIDAAKIVAYNLAHRLNKEKPEGDYLPHIAVPTTLSAAEFSGTAGYTDEASYVKKGISEELITPRVVILDPEATRWTPKALWLSSGIRSLDHAVETLYSPGVHPVSDVLAIQAIQDLFEFLPLSSRDAENLAYRQKCQLAAWMSYFAPASVGAASGMSHTIGKRIGATYGVPHGVTSCILLPPVMRYKALQAEDAARLAPAARRLDLVPANASDREVALAFADAVQNLVRRLGLPGRLRDVNVPESAFPDIAKASAGDGRSIALVEKILKQAW